MMLYESLAGSLFISAYAKSDAGASANQRPQQLHQPALLHRSLDEGGKQRVRGEGA
jgi:hypothetical protein